MSSSSEQEDLEVQDESSEEDVPSAEAVGADDDTEHEDESVAGESEPDGSGEGSAEEPALDASSTESDDDNEVDDNEDVPKPAKVDLVPQLNAITKKISEKYEKRQGRQLYIRFPEKLPESQEDFEAKVQSLSDLIVKSHKPRQKHARFCLVDFANSEDRDKTLKKLQKSKAETRVVASLPRTDSQEFVKILAEKKLKQIEKKKAKLLLKKERRKAEIQKEFTSTIVVLNIPKSASEAQVKELFPDAVDMQIRGAHSKYNGTSIATITLPSTADAKKNFHRSLTLGDNKLIIRFNTSFKKKHKKQNKNVAKKNVDGEDVPKKAPITPKAQGDKKAKKNKNKNKTNGAKATEEQQVPSKKQKLPLSKKRETGDVDSEVPQKKVKTVASAEAPQSKAKQAPKAKKGNQEESTNLPEKKYGAGPKEAGEKQKQKKKGKKPVTE